MTKTLMTTAAVAAMMVPMKASAQCTPNEDFVVVCTGVDEDGVVLNFEDLLVEEGAVVRADDTAVIGFEANMDVRGRVEGGQVGIAAEDSRRIGISGVVEGGRTGLVATRFLGGLDVSGRIEGGDVGIALDGIEGTTIAVSGTVEGGRFGITDGQRGTGFLRFDVAGTVRGGEAGIDLDDIEEVSVAQGALIASDGNGIRTGQGRFSSAEFTIDNDGTIEAGGNGVLIEGDGGRLFNTGTVRSGDGAFAGFDFATVVNSGVLSATRGDGVRADRDADVFNSGEIAADRGVFVTSGVVANASDGVITGTTGVGVEIEGGGSSSILTNEGTIRGATGVVVGRGARSAEIDNAGLIEGTDGVALRSDAQTILNLMGDARIVGDVRLSDEDDTLTIAEAAVVGGGLGSTLFDLGGGDDTVDLSGFLSTDVIGVGASVAAAEASRLVLATGSGGRNVLTFANAERFLFGDGAFSLSDFASDAVPLPAGAVLFASALGLGGVVRRRR